MDVFGLTITRRRLRQKTFPVPVTSITGGGWWPIWPNIREPFTGAWQQNASSSTETLLSNSAVFACLQRISGDIAKMRLRLVEQDDDGIWTETENPAYSPVLRKPNGYQTRLQFVESWLLSKLIYGNTYVLKRRDARGVVTDLYVLDPARTRVLVAPDGSVFYALSPEPLSTLTESQIAPAREILHDRWNTIYHQLVGVSPLHAAAVSAIKGLNIQRTTSASFASNSQPGATLNVPGSIAPETADRLKAYWDANFSTPVAILADGAELKETGFNAKDSELIAQLDWTAQDIARCFGMPFYKIGGPPPNYNNIQALNVEYYVECLQRHIEDFESVLDEGLGLGPEFGNRFGTEFDLEDLLRMDTGTMMTTIQTGVQAGVLAPNEGRRMINQPPVAGGDTPYLQQQQFSLEALNKRDEANPAPSSAQPGAAPSVPRSSEVQTDEDMPDEPMLDGQRMADLFTRKAFEAGLLTGVF